MKGLKLLATGRALPSQVLSNEDMSRFVETSDEWIGGRTGIRQRYFCAEGENATTLAIAAAKQAMERSGAAPEEIGCVVVATSSGEYVMPSTASTVHGALGLPEDIPTLDVGAACAGFLYAVEVARGLLLGNGKRCALVIGTEQMSSVLDMTDRTTCVLFGDGAGAAVFALDEEREYVSVQGTRSDPAIRSGCPGITRQVPMTMDGQAVFRFAAAIIPKCVQDLFAKGGKNMDDVDWVVCHQANERILDASIRRLGGKDKFYKNIDRYANTSAASIPIVLDEMNEQGLLKEGQRVVMVGFGGGLTWAGVMLCI